MQVHAQVLRLEPHVVVSNLAGVPLQLLHFRDAEMSETFDDQAGGATHAPALAKGGAAAGQLDVPAGTPCHWLPTGGSPRLLADGDMRGWYWHATTFVGGSAPAARPLAMSRQPTAQPAAALCDLAMPEAAPAHCAAVCAGASGVPFAWSLAGQGRRLCMRLQPARGDVQPRWSHPVSHSFPVGQAKDVVLPVQPPGQDRVRLRGAWRGRKVHAQALCSGLRHHHAVQDPNHAACRQAAAPCPGQDWHADVAGTCMLANRLPCFASPAGAQAFEEPCQRPLMLTLPAALPNPCLGAPCPLICRVPQLPQHRRMHSVAPAV